jgi:hypothetical protein
LFQATSKPTADYIVGREVMKMKSGKIVFIATLAILATGLLTASMFAAARPTTAQYGTYHRVLSPNGGYACGVMGGMMGNGYGSCSGYPSETNGYGGCTGIWVRP